MVQYLMSPPTFGLCLASISSTLLIVGVALLRNNANYKQCWWNICAIAVVFLAAGQVGNSWVVCLAWVWGILRAADANPKAYALTVGAIVIFAASCIGFIALVANQGDQWWWHFVAPGALICIVAPTIAAIANWSEVKGVRERHAPKLRRVVITGGLGKTPDRQILIGKLHHGGGIRR